MVAKLAGCQGQANSWPNADFFMSSRPSVGAFRSTQLSSAARPRPHLASLSTKQYRRRTAWRMALMWLLVVIARLCYHGRHKTKEAGLTNWTISKTRRHVT